MQSNLRLPIGLQAGSQCAQEALFRAFRIQHQVYVGVHFPSLFSGPNLSSEELDCNVVCYDELSRIVIVNALNAPNRCPLPRRYNGFIERCDRCRADPGRLCSDKANKRESVALSVRLRFHRERRELRVTDLESGQSRRIR
jgi:hypothetical protein